MENDGEERSNNEVILVGVMASDFNLDHKLYGEKFYRVKLAVCRDSGKVDLVPVLISDRLINARENYIDQYVCIKGQFRSYNEHGADKNRLVLYVFALSVELLDEAKNFNDVFLEGYICKTPTYRHTPQGREICDIMLAVNRQYGKSDYIPCICWGRNAYFVKNLKAGSSLRVAGRIQSREYNKNGERKTAYELSVNLVELV